MPALEPYVPEQPNEQLDDLDDENKDIEDNEDEEELLRRRMRDAQRVAENNDEEESRSRRKNKASASSSKLVDEPVVEDPYANDESSFLIPVLVAIGAFIPLLFCLCKI